MSLELLSQRGSVDRKAEENLSGVGMRLCVKLEVDACRILSGMPGQTDRETDAPPPPARSLPHRERKREREGKRERVCVCERERECVCVCVCV